jgi:hypothetical protein
MNVQKRMDQRLDRRDFKNFIPSSPEEAKYYEATKRVKKIKGFYTHALVYVVINIGIVIINIKNLNPGESYFKLENFFTLFFWGLGLLAHGLSVFLPNFIFGQDWEEKKIKQFMEEEKKKSWQ